MEAGEDSQSCDNANIPHAPSKSLLTSPYVASITQDQTLNRNVISSEKHAVEASANPQAISVPSDPPHYHDCNAPEATSPPGCALASWPFQSRQVVITSLPREVSLAQINSSISARWGLVKLHLFQDLHIRNMETMAQLEFVRPEAAHAFVQSTEENPLRYVCPGETATVHTVKALLVPTPSSPFSLCDRLLLERQQTRRMVIDQVTAEYVWYLMDSFGVRHILAAEYRTERQALTLEFDSLFHAEQAKRLVRSLLASSSNGGTLLPELQVTFVDEACESRVRSAAATPHIDQHLIQKRFFKQPFTDYYVARSSGLSTVVQDNLLYLSELERLCRRLDCDEDELNYMLHDFPKKEPIRYRILGSTIILTRRTWGWSLSGSDEDKLLMANTLHDEEWRDHWDTYFESRQIPNLRKYEAYGMLAAERRKYSSGDDGGAFACPQEVPRVIREYLSYA